MKQRRKRGPGSAVVSRFDTENLSILENSEFAQNLESLAHQFEHTQRFSQLLSNRLSTQPERDIKVEKSKRYAFTYYMGMGLSHSYNKKKTTVDGLAKISKPKKVLDVTDFMVRNVWPFPSKGSKDGTPQHEAGYFTFTEYAPEVFRKLRAHYGVTEEEYRDELTEHGDLIEFITNSKSKSFFFHSFHGDYIVKSQGERETEVLLKLLPSYYHHMVAFPNTLLVKMCGLYFIQAHNLRRKGYFIVMKSVYSYSRLSQQKNIHSVFDLKGSSIGRRASSKDPVKKDLDIKEMIESNEVQKIHLGGHKTSFLQQLGEDTLWLQKHNIMDYSLLVAVNDSQRFEKNKRTTMAFDQWEHRFLKTDVISDGNNPHLTNRLSMRAKKLMSAGNSTVSSSSRSKPLNTEFTVIKSRVVMPAGGSPPIYFLGIIDILQEYNCKKIAENLVKSVKKENRGKISAVPARQYKQRFDNFMSKELIG